VKKSERVRRKWRDTVASLGLVVVIGVAIDVYDIWRSLRETGSADWKLWLAPIALALFATFFLGFANPIKSIILRRAEHEERR
jgi:hypothetical protein